MEPSVSRRDQLLRQEGVSKPIRDTAWKVQTRLCGLYRNLSHTAKSAKIAATAIARELSGFVWAKLPKVSPA